MHMRLYLEIRTTYQLIRSVRVAFTVELTTPTTGWPLRSTLFWSSSGEHCISVEVVFQSMFQQATDSDLLPGGRRV